MIYSALNLQVLSMAPLSAKRVLDLGCGTGTFGGALKGRQPCEVIGVTFNPEEANLARGKLDTVVVADLNEYNPAPLGTFDCVVCSHVLEHLYRPQELLSRLGPCLSGGGVLLVALPNVLFWRQRLRFSFGAFRYTNEGLMDTTHYRFFDWWTAREMIEQSGLQILEAVADGYLPGSWLLPPLQRPLNGLAIRTFPGLFGFQFRFRCGLPNGDPSVPKQSVTHDRPANPHSANKEEQCLL